MTPQQIARAWHSVTDQWIVRRNKAHEDRQWEVVHDWGVDIVSEDTRKIVDRFDSQIMADRFAKQLEDAARGRAVITALTSGQRDV